MKLNGVKAGKAAHCDLFGAKGGTQLGAMLEAIRNTDAGKQIMDAVGGDKK